MSSNQPLRLPLGYYVVKGPKGYAVYADSVAALREIVAAELRQTDMPDELLVRITPWRSTRYGALTQFALNQLNKNDIHKPT